MFDEQDHSISIFETNFKVQKLINQKKIKFDAKDRHFVKQLVIGKWVYSGQVKMVEDEQVPDGLGRITQQEHQIIYEGEIKDSVWQGYGRMLYDKYGIYEGEFLQSCFRGDNKFIELISGVMRQGHMVGIKDDMIEYFIKLLP